MVVVWGIPESIKKELGLLSPASDGSICGAERKKIRIFSGPKLVLHKSLEDLDL